jgi:hypothetical protein
MQFNIKKKKKNGFFFPHTIIIPTQFRPQQQDWWWNSAIDWSAHAPRIAVSLLESDVVALSLSTPTIS